MLVRMVFEVLKAAVYPIRRITLIGDSECTIASVNATSTVLAPFFSNRVAEIIDTMAEWGELIDDQAVEGNDDRPRLFYQLVRYMALGYLCLPAHLQLQLSLTLPQSLPETPK